ncbi:MAG: thiamine-phosphate kinase [Nitrospirota bacterium]
MQLRQVGELALLRELQKKFSRASHQDRSVIVGIGDDAAVIAPGREDLMITTDMMTEGVHFDLGYCAPFHLGFKLVSVNVSDIMAMGGAPRYLFLNIAVKEDADEAFFWELYEGIAEAMTLYGVALLGGDLSATLHDMALSATVIGSGERPVTRAGASPGDKIYVTAATGDAACGLALLTRLAPESRALVKGWRFREREGLPALSLQQNDRQVTLPGERIAPLLRRHLMPVARDARPFRGLVTAMLDVSDGLFIDLGRLCDASGVGARVYRDRIPVSDAVRYAAGLLGLDPFACATAGGEDYELLFTASPEAADEAIDAICIGEITGNERTLVDAGGRASELKIEGYQHFADS